MIYDVVFLSFELFLQSRCIFLQNGYLFGERLFFVTDSLIVLVECLYCFSQNRNFIRFLCQPFIQVGALIFHILEIYLGHFSFFELQLKNLYLFFLRFELDWGSVDLDDSRYTTEMRCGSMEGVSYYYPILWWISSMNALSLYNYIWRSIGIIPKSFDLNWLAFELNYKQ